MEGSDRNSVRLLHKEAMEFHSFFLEICFYNYKWKI